MVFFTFLAIAGATGGAGCAVFAASLAVVVIVIFPLLRFCALGLELKFYGLCTPIHPTRPLEIFRGSVVNFIWLGTLTVSDQINERSKRTCMQR